MTFKILVLHGPNLNVLGSREPAVYGGKTLAEIDEALLDRAAASGATLTAFQSNHEGVLIDRLHTAREEHIDFIVINPAAFTHTSIALRDALAYAEIPFVEVHLSNIHRREPFRHTSYFSDLAHAVVCGMGWQGYLYAVDYGLSQILNK